MVCNRKRNFCSLPVYSKVQFIFKRSKCILSCDHKPLEPFLSCDMKIPKLYHWSMEFSDYNCTFIHIKGSNNILAMQFPDWRDYKDPLDYPKISDTVTYSAEMITTNIQTISVDKLHTKKRIFIVGIWLHSHIMKTRIPSTQCHDFPWWSSTKMTICTWTKIWCYHNTIFCHSSNPKWFS